MKLISRPVNDTEYNAINEEYKKDHHTLGNAYEYKDVDRNDIIVYDVNDDFKIINYNYCGILLQDGKEHVMFGTDRFAFKYGLLYLYEQDDNIDDCVEDIDELFKTN